MGFPAPCARVVPYAQTEPPYIPAASIHIRNPRASQFLHIGLMPAETGARLRQACAGGSHTHQSPFGNSQKTAKSTNPTSRRPYTVAHVSQIPMRLGSTYGPSPHTFYADPTYCPQAPKISTLVSIRPAFPALQIPNQSGPYKFLNPRLHLHGHGGHGPVCIRAQANSPRPAAGSPKIHASNRSAQIPQANDGGGAWTPATAMRRRRRQGNQCLSWFGLGPDRTVSLKAGLGTAVRLEAGNCEDGFASLFQVHAVFSHQACTDGPIFFCIICSRRVCRNPHSVCGLFWIPPPPFQPTPFDPEPFSSTCANCRVPLSQQIGDWCVICWRLANYQSVNSLGKRRGMAGGMVFGPELACIVDESFFR